jgi:hypothetical protein
MGYDLTIPMPGHTVGGKEIYNLLKISFGLVYFYKRFSYGER